MDLMGTPWKGSSLHNPILSLANRGHHYALSPEDRYCIGNLPFRNSQVHQ